MLSARVRRAARTSRRRSAARQIDALEAEARARPQRRVEEADRALDRARRTPRRARRLCRAKWIEGAERGAAPGARGRRCSARGARRSAPIEGATARGARAGGGGARGDGQRARTSSSGRAARLAEGAIEEPRYEAVIEVRARGARGPPRRGRGDLPRALRAAGGPSTWSRLGRRTDAGAGRATAPLEIVTHGDRVAAHRRGLGRRRGALLHRAPGPRGEPAAARRRLLTLAPQDRLQERSRVEVICASRR